MAAPRLASRGVKPADSPASFDVLPRVEALRDRNGDLGSSVRPGYAAGEKFVVPSVDVPDVSPRCQRRRRLWR